MVNVRLGSSERVLGGGLLFNFWTLPEGVLVERGWICELRGAAKATVRAASSGGLEAVRPGPQCAGGASAPAGQQTAALDDPGRGRHQPRGKVRLPP